MRNVWKVLRTGGLASLVVVASAASIPRDSLAGEYDLAAAQMLGSPESVGSMNDCFGCYPGGSGVPVICDFGEHFDRTGSSEFFQPRSEMHNDCDSAECSEHSECQPTEETMDALTAAVADNDVVTLRQLLSVDPKVEFNVERGAIQMLGCRDEVVLHLPVGVGLLAALAGLTK